MSYLHQDLPLPAWWAHWSHGDEASDSTDNALQFTMVSLKRSTSSLVSPSCHCSWMMFILYQIYMNRLILHNKVVQPSNLSLSDWLWFLYGSVLIEINSKTGIYDNGVVVETHVLQCYSSEPKIWKKLNEMKMNHWYLIGWNIWTQKFLPVQ